MLTSLGTGFVLGWVGSMPVAGAVSIFVFQRGLAGRVRDGFYLSLGAAIAEGLWCAVARFGASQLLNRWPNLGRNAEIFGGILLIALGFYFFRLRNNLPIEATDITKRPAYKEFALGFTLVAANLAIPINWLALIALATTLGFHPTAGPPGTLSLGITLGIIAWFTLLLTILNHYRSNFTPKNLAKIMKSMAALLAITGLIALLRTLIK